MGNGGGEKRENLRLRLGVAGSTAMIDRRGYVYVYVSEAPKSKYSESDRGTSSLRV